MFNRNLNQTDIQIHTVPNEHLALVLGKRMKGRFGIGCGENGAK